MLRHPLTLLTREAPPLVISPASTCLLLQDLHVALADPDDEVRWRAGEVLKAWKVEVRQATHETTQIR